MIRAACVRGGRPGRGQLVAVNSVSKVEARYAGSFVTFTEQQLWWLDRIADVISTYARVACGELDSALHCVRGVDGAVRDLAADGGTLLKQLDAELTA